MKVQNIPQTLKDLGEFCCWKYEVKYGRKGKVPYNPATGYGARTNDPSTFVTYETAVNASGYDGIGIRVSGQYVGIDLDHCVEDGNIDPWAKEITDRFADTYIEVSPSGEGIRIFCLLPDDLNYDTETYYIKKGGIEVYIPGYTNRFLTVTGNALTQADVTETAEAPEWLLNTYMRRPTPTTPAAVVCGKSYLSDDSVIAKASAAVNGEKFTNLWNGDISGYSSRSEADAALVSILAFWCSGDTEQIDRLFRTSPLIREKWDEHRGADTYGNITIAKVVSKMTDFYKPIIKPSAAEDFGVDRLKELNPMDSAKDTSKKIRAVFKAKGESGKPLCTKPPYGYLKDPNDKHHWIVDEDAAKVVREIFKLCMDGYGPTQIANILTERKIENPTAHAKRMGLNPPARQFYDDPYLWRDSTVTHILSGMEYIGHTVNFKTYRKSYKNKKQMHNAPSDWQIFKNTHEAIVDEAVFEIVQKIRDGRRKVTPMGEMPILSGMLFCADCSAKLYQVRGRGWEHSKKYFVCATYRKIKGGCTSLQIRNVVIEESLLDDIRRITAFAKDHEAKFLEMVTIKTKVALDRSLRENKRELEQATQRIRKLDEIIQRLYEDNLEGKITDECFAKMTANYEAEQHTLEHRVAELRAAISAEKETVLNADHFLSLVRKYTEIPELTAEIIREFVEKVYVYKAEKVDGHRVQRIKTIYNCTGEFTLPDAARDEKTA